MSVLVPSAQSRLDDAVDLVLDALDYAEKTGVEVDPLATIVQRMRERGADLDLSEQPMLVQMLLGGMLE